MKYILKYQNPSSTIIKTGQFLPNEGKPWGTAKTNTKYSGDKSKPKTKYKPKVKEQPDAVADILSELGTRTLSAVGSFGGSVIGDAVNDFISPAAADAVEKYTLGVIPHTSAEQFEANKQPGNWSDRMNQAAKAGAMGLMGQGTTALMTKYAPVIANKIANRPANDMERAIQKLSDPKKLEKFAKQLDADFARFPAYDLRGKYTNSTARKKLIEARTRKHEADLEYTKNPALTGKSKKLYLQPYEEAIEKVKLDYQQKIADKLGLPIDYSMAKSGAHGTVSKVKNQPNLVVKIGGAPDFETPETMYHLSQIGKELQDPNIALPIKTTFYKGRNPWDTNISQIMPFVKGTPQRQPFVAPQESFNELVDKVKLLKGKGVEVDFMNPENVLYDEATNKFSLVDLNTTPPQYHHFNAVNTPNRPWERVLQERYQSAVPEPPRSTVPSPVYSFGENAPKFVPESFTVNPVKRVNMWSMFKQ